MICVDWYEPGYKAGGPIRSVANIVSSLKDQIEFYVLTSAYDLGDEEPYEGVIINEWFDKDGVFLKYMDKKSLNFDVIRRNILEINPDRLYLNSLFSKKFTLFPLMVAKRSGIKVIIAPRGMLGDGALEIKKGKKQTFIIISRLIGLFSGVCWHASTEDEAQEIRSKFGRKAKVRIAQNIPQAQKLKLDNILSKKKTGSIRFIYVSRIAVKKNLHLAVQAMKRIKTEKAVEFHIYGVIDDWEYWDSFKDEINDTECVKIEYKGVVPPSELPEIYSNADFMVLPTKHENYGHVIVEAWSNGCPVIISRKTPWKNLHVQNLGWDIDLKNFDNLVQALQEAVDLDFASYVTQVTACYNYFRNVITDAEVLEANRKLFEK